MFGDDVIYTDVTILKICEKGRVREYIDFLFYRSNSMEKTIFAAPFIKGDPVTENLTLEQSCHPDELKRMIPDGRAFHHIVLKYYLHTTDEEAYLWTKQFLRDVGIQSLCIIFLHAVNDRYCPYHAHVLISPEYPMKVLLGDPDSIETYEMDRRWQEATDRIPDGSARNPGLPVKHNMVYDETRYSPNELITM